MTPWLVLRPEPGATATVEAIAAMGRRAIKAPLFRIRPVDFAVSDAARHDAVLLTSANAARALAGRIGSLADKPAYAVGLATAEAAQAAGFTRVVTGDGDAAAIVARAASDGARALLHVAGRDHRAILHPDVTITPIVAYAAEPVATLPPDLVAVLDQPFIRSSRPPSEEIDVAPAAPSSTLGTNGAEDLGFAPPLALLHSPRAAALFARLLDEAGLSRVGVALAALSPAVAEAAGIGWAAVAIAKRPADAALLAAAARLCDTGATEG